MKGAIVATALATFCVAAPLQAQRAEPCRYFTFILSLNVSLTNTNNAYSADSAVTCYDEYTNPYQGAFYAEAYVNDETATSTVDMRSFDSTQCYTCAISTWWAYLSGIATANHCFRAHNYAFSPWYEQGTATVQSCASDDPVCTVTTYISTDGYRVLVDGQSGRVTCGSYQTLTATASAGFHFVEWDGTYHSDLPTISFTAYGDVEETAVFESDPPPPPPTDDGCGAEWPSSCSPIIVNFEAAPYKLTGVESPVEFDIAATGTPVRIGWTAAGADEAFLCLDRDHDGKITSGAELFGNATPLKDGRPAGNGFIALTEYDANGDDTIDSRDPVWPQLQLWRDVNHNGVAESSELTSVVGSPLAAISLQDHWTGRRDVSGNVFRYESRVWIVDRANRAVPRSVYDIFLIRVP